MAGGATNKNSTESGCGELMTRSPFSYIFAEGPAVRVRLMRFGFWVFGCVGCASYAVTRCSNVLANA